MKILYHHRIAARDGMDVHKTELIKAFKALGHEVIEVGPGSQSRADFGSSPAWVDGIRRHLPGWLGEVLELVYNEYASRKLAKAYLIHKPDILYERNNLFLSAGKRVKEKFGVPFFLEVNAPLADERATNGGLSLRRLARQHEQGVWKSADRILPVSTVLARQLVSVGVEVARIKVVPNGVDPEVFRADTQGRSTRSKYGLSGALVLGFAGFVRDWHGLDAIVQCLPHLSQTANVHLLVVGDGPARVTLTALAAKLNVSDRVHFTGVIARNGMPYYLAAFDIALQPAVTPYASPLKLMEYISMGKRVLAPDQENIRETLGPAQGVFLFGKDDQLSQLELAIADALSSGSSIKGQTTRTWQDNARSILSDQI